MFYNVEISYSISMSKFLRKVEKCMENTINVEIYGRTRRQRTESVFLHQSLSPVSEV
jgi:hypothetical protein